EVVERYLDLERERASGGRAKKVHPFPPSQQIAPPKARYEATVEDPQLKQAVMEACHLPDAQAIWREVTETEPYDVTDGDTPVVQGTGEVRVLSVRVLDGQGRPRERFQTGEDLVVAATFRTSEPVTDPIFGVAVFRNDGVYVHGPNSAYDKVLDGTYKGIYTFFIQWAELPLLSGHYRISVAVFDSSHLKPHVWHNQLYDFEVVQDVEDHGMVLMQHAWGLITHLEE
ncbi:MAG: Wzt carbohydrate-binding domain-containing protein, partial [Myxococcota bacterium]|nr:Wzt carbohydrate-binding domain-containing protein [Myxococcota bacterium]